MLKLYKVAANPAISIRSCQGTVLAALYRARDVCFDQTSLFSLFSIKNYRDSVAARFLSGSSVKKRSGFSMKPKLSKTFETVSTVLQSANTTFAL
jgi:hypothetical protein